MAAREFDLIVIGGGTGRDIVLAGEAAGLDVALVERQLIGGTCHNRGCMPSKMLIQSSEVAQTARAAARFDVDAHVHGADFPAMLDRVFGVLDEERIEREAYLDASDHIEFYRAEARFLDAHTVEVGDVGGGELITAPRIVIAAGSRVTVPPIPGLDAVPYLVSDDVFHLDALPGRLVIIGGGPIALEMANFFGGLGTEVTLLAIENVLAEREDREIAEWFTREYARRFRVELSTSAEDFAQTSEGIAMTLRPSGERLVVDQLLVAAGRRPNSDTLNLEAAGVEVGPGGGIVVNDEFETTAEGVWAFGDVTDLMPLKHVSVRQARNLIRQLFFGEHPSLDYDLVPHSTFAHPQIAAVGRTEEALRAAGVAYHVGRYELQHTARGMALQENGLAKILVDEGGRILGGHIVGPHASILIQEIVVAMQAGGAIEHIVEAVHAHPALPQLVEEAAKAAKAAQLAARTSRRAD